jgi:hypothetical protein
MTAQAIKNKMRAKMRTGGVGLRPPAPVCRWLRPARMTDNVEEGLSPVLRQRIRE